MNKKLPSITLYIIFFDALLNWWLGFFLTLLPRTFQNLLVSESIGNPLWLVPVGMSFLLFASWQLGLIRRWELKARELKLAAMLAWGPVVLLTVLLLLRLPLLPVARRLLWIGDIYMILLGGWYWWVSRKL